MTALVLPHAPEPIRAWIQHDYWLAKCGTLYCRNALRLDYGDGFLCDRCGVAFDVIWPTPETAQKIVAVLSYRPDWATRNWLPDESLDELLMENFEHGIDHSVMTQLGAASHLWLDGLGGMHVSEEPLLLEAAAPIAIGA
jgi:hypothetical protein